MKINLDDYRLEEIENYNVKLLLNNKHKLEDFENAIIKAVKNHQEEINEYGDDWCYISQDLDEFDYIEL